MIDERLDGCPQDDELAPEPSRHRAMRALAEGLALAGIILLALALRFTGIRWGTGYYLHPDELFMTSVVSRISAPDSFAHYLESATSPLNPFNHDTGFVYGTFPLFAAEFLGQFTGYLAERYPDTFTAYTDVSTGHIPGRWISAVADTGTVVLAWWIGRMLFDRLTGLLAAFLLACTMLHIQAAHYFTTDAPSAFFATATFAFVLAAWQTRRWSFHALAGFALGLAVASKPNLLAAIGFLGLPLLETIRCYGWGALRPGIARYRDTGAARDFPIILASALSLFVAVWTFRLLQPYAFQGPGLFSFRFDQRWLDDIAYWRLIQSGEIDYYPGIQWVERAPVLFVLENMVKWGMGPGLGLAALAGVGILAWRMLVRSTWPSWMLLGPVGWIAFHVLYFGSGLVKTQRYLLPAYPLMIVLAAMTLVLLVRWASRHGALVLPRRGRSVRLPVWIHPGYVVPTLVVVSTLLYALAFSTIYSRPQTRAEASVWIAQNVPDGSVLGTEYWDLGLPVGVPEVRDKSYTGVNLHLYADETPDKVREIVSALQQVDYVILSSNRLIDSITRMPERYPMATRYYEALYSGELGFEQVAHFTSFPELFGIAIDDRGAEETLTVYDHPEVTVFRKTEAWNANDAWYLLNDALGQGGLDIRPIETQPHRMMLDDAAQADLAVHGAWRDIVDPGSWVNRVPVLPWYLALQALSFPAALVLWRLVPWLPDRGYALAKILGPFAVGWVVWWLCSWQFLAFGRGIAVLAWFALTAGAVALAWPRRQTLWSDVKARLGWIASSETLLLGGLLLATWVRGANPDLWIPNRTGTQLQDMATFTATVRTPHFPAYDPWFAGGTIHDVTFGMVPWAMVTRVTGIAPETAYSLALATLAALVLLASWAAAAALIAHWRPASRPLGTIVGALLAPLMTLLIGSWSMAQRIGADDWTLNFEGTPLDALRGLWDTVTAGTFIPRTTWHSIDTYVGPGILEFPLLAYLTNELAVHQLAMPVFLAGITLLIGYLGQPHRQATGVLALPGGLGAGVLFLGGMGLVSSWTLASNLLAGAVLLGLCALLLLFTMLTRESLTGTWPLVRDGVLALAVVVGVMLLAAWPFLYHYGHIPTHTLPLAQGMAVSEFVGLIGAASVVVAGYLAWQLAAFGRDLVRDRVVGIAELAGVTVLLLAAVVLAWLVGHLLLFLMLVFLLIGLVAWRHHLDPRHLLIPGILLASVGLGAIANRMRLEDWSPQQDIPLQFTVVAWLLLGVVAAPIIVRSFMSAWEHGPETARVAGRVASVAWTVLLVVAIGAGAVYTVLALPVRAGDRIADTGPTLDATAFMAEGQLEANARGMQVAPFALAGDLQAIAWMRAHLDGVPVILETPGEPGTWAGRVSALTGYPTVLGPPAVQQRQRPGMDRMIAWRRDDIERIYGETGPYTGVIPLILRYNIEYIYVGALERVTYGSEALAKFDAAVTDGLLEIAYQEGDVTLYRVLPAVG